MVFPFPVEAGTTCLTEISAEELAKLRTLEDAEGFERFTCRPIHLRTRDELVDFYAGAVGKEENCFCGIRLAESGILVGKVTAGDWNPRNGAAEIGYFISQAYRGKGCMSAALEAFCAALFRMPGIRKLTAQTAAFNKPSICLLERLGFHRDGILRQHHPLDGVYWDDYLYCLLEDELKINRIGHK